MSNSLPENWLSIGRSYQPVQDLIVAPQKSSNRESDDKKHSKSKRKHKHTSYDKHKKKKHKHDKHHRKDTTNDHDIIDDSFDSSSDDETSLQVIANIDPSHSVTYMPNGKMVVLSKRSENESKSHSTVQWDIDRCYDDDLALYKVTLPQHVSKYNVTSLFTGETISNSEVSKQFHRLPTGNLIPINNKSGKPATSDSLSKVDQIFKQKYQLASTTSRQKELRFLRSQRYCYSSRSGTNNSSTNNGGENLLDPTLNRLCFNHTFRAYDSNKSDSTNAIISRDLIPVPFIDFKALLSKSDETNSVSSQYELIQTHRLKSTASTAGKDTQHKGGNIQTDISIASRVVYNYTRNYNKYTREYPQDIATLLRIVSSQDILDQFQHVAAGKDVSILLARSCALSRRRNNTSNTNYKVVMERKIGLLEYALKQLQPDSLNIQSINQYASSIATLQLYLFNLLVQNREESGKVIAFLDTAMNVASNDAVLATRSSLYVAIHEFITTKYRHILSVFNDVNYTYSRDAFSGGILRRLIEQLNHSAVREIAASVAVEAKVSYWESITASAKEKNERLKADAKLNQSTASTSINDNNDSRISMKLAPQLLFDTECLQIVLLAQWLLLERQYGNKEKQFAVIQALLDCSLTPGKQSTLSTFVPIGHNEYERFWESEHLRLGEAELFPVTSSTIVPSESLASVKCTGYALWEQRQQTRGHPGSGSDSNDNHQFVATDYDSITEDKSVMSLFVQHEVNTVDEPQVDSEVQSRTIDVQNNDNNDILLSTQEEEVQRDDVTATFPDTAEDMVLETSTSHEIQSVKTPAASRHSRKRASDFFAASETNDGEEFDELNAKSALYQIRHAKASVDDDEEDVPLSTEPLQSAESGENDPTMVYSAVHGYKIKITEEDTARPYKKLLGETVHTSQRGAATDEAEEERGMDFNAMSTKEILQYYEEKNKTRKNKNNVSDDTMSHMRFNALQSYSESTQLEDAVVTDVVKWRQDIVVSVFQHSPLRLNTKYRLAACDTKSSEQEEQEGVVCSEFEPERVVMFREDLSGYLFTPTSLLTRQRLVVRCLQTIAGNGLYFPHCEYSHSSFARSVAQYQQPGNYLIDMHYGLFQHSLSSSSIYHKTSPSTQQYDCFDRLASDYAKLNSVCLVRNDIIMKHIISVQTNRSTSSELNMVINLVAELLENNNYYMQRGLTEILSFDFICELRSVLISLLLTRYLSEQRVTNVNNGSDSSALATLRQQCQKIIEGSVSASNLVGDMHVWCEYIESECTLGGSNYDEAKKLADKILKALSTQHGASGGLSVSISGTLRFYWLCMRLCLGCNLIHTSIPSHLSQSNSLPATSISVTLAHSGLLRCMTETKDNTAEATEVGLFCNTLGVYTGVLKPAKQTEGKKKVDKTKSNVTTQSVSSAIAIIGHKIRELCMKFKKSLADSKQQRESERTAGVKRVVLTPCSQFHIDSELLHLVTIQSWLMYLQHAEVSESIGIINRVQTADNCFLSHIKNIKSMLIQDEALPSIVDTARPAAASRHLNQILGGPFDCGDVDSCDFILRNSSGVDLWHTVGESSSVAHAEAFGNVVVCSQLELTHVVTLERLHINRVAFLLTSLRDEKASQSDRAAIVQLVLRAARQGLDSFPLNPVLLHTLTSVQQTQPGGYLSMMAYFGRIHRTRVYWGGGLTVRERLCELQCEIHRADSEWRQTQYGDGTTVVYEENKTTIVDPLDNCKSYDDHLSLDCFTHCSRWSVENYKRIKSKLESILSAEESPHTYSSYLFWRCYIQLEVGRTHYEDAKKVLYRAIGSCAYCRDLYMEAVGPLRSVFSDKELASVLQVMEDKQIHMRQL